VGGKVVCGAAGRGERLAAEGVSVRRIAAEVFGDSRFWGRVERILRPRAAPEPLQPADPALAELDLSEFDWTALLRLLFKRRLAFWAASQSSKPRRS
jgi:hypothetical protein